VAAAAAAPVSFESFVASVLRFNLSHTVLMMAGMKNDMTNERMMMYACMYVCRVCVEVKCEQDGRWSLSVTVIGWGEYLLVIGLGLKSVER
jgi:hypothetical protein